MTNIEKIKGMLFYFLLDSSASMKVGTTFKGLNGWIYLSQHIGSFYKKIREAGVAAVEVLNFSGHVELQNVVDYDKLKSLLGNTKIGGNSFLAPALSMGFESYFASKLDNKGAAFFIPIDGYPMDHQGVLTILDDYRARIVDKNVKVHLFQLGTCVETANWITTITDKYDFVSGTSWDVIEGKGLDEAMVGAVEAL